MYFVRVFWGQMSVINMLMYVTGKQYGIAYTLTHRQNHIFQFISCSSLFFLSCQMQVYLYSHELSPNPLLITPLYVYRNTGSRLILYCIIKKTQLWFSHSLIGLFWVRVQPFPPQPLISPTVQFSFCICPSFLAVWHWVKWPEMTSERSAAILSSISVSFSPKVYEREQASGQ